jgi:hypothetical protein
MSRRKRRLKKNKKSMHELVTLKESRWSDVQGYDHLQYREKYRGGINTVLNTFGSEYLEIY